MVLLSHIDFWSFLKEQAKKEVNLRTLSEGREFILSSRGVDVMVIPQSTMQGRLIKFEDVRRVWARFESTGSLEPGTYQDLSRNASYILAVLVEYMKANRVKSSQSE